MTDSFSFPKLKVQMFSKEIHSSKPRNVTQYQGTTKSFQINKYHSFPKELCEKVTIQYNLGYQSYKYCQ